MERDRRGHLPRKEHEFEELRDAAALRYILVLRRRVRVLPETPERYVTYVHSHTIISFIHQASICVLRCAGFRFARCGLRLHERDVGWRYRLPEPLC